jgi:hypothetical protein
MPFIGNLPAHFRANRLTAHLLFDYHHTIHHGDSGADQTQ